MHSGFLSDDWGTEFEDQSSHGWDMYLYTLAQYLKYFTGRPGTYVYAEGPKTEEGHDAWAILTEGLGLTGPVSNGDQLRLTPEGLAPIEGVVDYIVPGHREFLDSGEAPRCIGSTASPARSEWDTTSSPKTRTLRGSQKPGRNG